MAANKGRSRRARLYVDVGGGAVLCAVTGGGTGGSWRRNSADRGFRGLRRRRWRRRRRRGRRRQQERPLGLSLTMPTVEELYRNYGILADATEQVGQVSPRAACRARRSAASRKGSEPGGDCPSPSRGLPAAGLFRLDGLLSGSVDSCLHQGERRPRFPGSSPSLDQPFLTVAFPNSLINFPLILSPSFAFLISKSFSFSVKLR